jgi:hypothetical protein
MSIRTEPTYEERLAAKKRADRYIARDGSAPSILSRRRDGRRQDLNDDDRRHLRFCLSVLRLRVAHQEEAKDCLEYIQAILERDYGLSKGSD